MNIEVILSVSVGILTLLTTFLVCWQFYNTYQLDKYRRTLDGKLKQVMQDNKHLSYAMFSLTTSYFAINNNKDLNECITFHFDAIGEVNNITNKEIRDEITGIVSSLIGEIVNRNNNTLQITTKQKEDFLKIAEKSSNKKELQRTINTIKIVS
jgi:hypothetical protein|nr:MAG TPA: hypothetical protein [Caudoviricetes sp.]DAT13782.1 MAG TPA: hypothetical protein [Caudoviricetes sp.]